MLFSGVVLYSSSVRFNDALYVRRFVCSIFSRIWTEYGDLIHFIPMLLFHLPETIGKLDFFHVSSGNEKKKHWSAMCLSSMMEIFSHLIKSSYS